MFIAWTMTAYLFLFRGLVSAGRVAQGRPAIHHDWTNFRSHSGSKSRGKRRR